MAYQTTGLQGFYSNEKKTGKRSLNWNIPEIKVCHENFDQELSNDPEFDSSGSFFKVPLGPASLWSIWIQIGPSEANLQAYHWELKSKLLMLLSKF